MPTKTLPEKIDIDELKQQAKDLLIALRRSEPSALQRVREFHPAAKKLSDVELSRQSYTLGDAQLTLAREYGISNWRRLHETANSILGIELELPHHERIEDPLFRKAVDFVDEGDIDALRSLLDLHPEIITQTVRYEDGNYFRNPSLLEFVAENPVRHNSLPYNVVAVAKLILDKGAKQHSDSIGCTLSLVSSGRVIRECGLQVPMIDLLCDYGASPDGAMNPALGHGEFEAANALIRRGATVDLVAAAAMGRVEDAKRQLDAASSEQRHQALAMGTQHGHATVVALLLDAGEDPNRYNPVGFHAHSTPLHQAALSGHLETVKLLVSRGARVDIEDINFQTTARVWADHGGHEEIGMFLEQLEPD